MPTPEKKSEPKFEPPKLVEMEANDPRLKQNRPPGTMLPARNPAAAAPTNDRAPVPAVPVPPGPTT